MNQYQSTFDFQKLTVDYLAFKFQELEDSTKQQIANYLFEIGFNSYQESGKLAKPIKEAILIHPEHRLEVCFVEDNAYWKGTFLNFSGFNASRFYGLAKERKIDWEIFTSGVLSRIDLYYSRDNQKDDIPIREFLEDCDEKLKQTNRNISFEKNSKGLIFKIGNRRSNHYSRIYQGNNCLKFEYEMKGKFLQKYHSFLVENQLEELENQLSSNFINYFGKLLPLSSSYLDWLVIKLRPVRKEKLPSDSFQMDYIHSEIDVDLKTFFSLLQFLKYAESLNFETEYLGDVSYRKVSFSVRDFLKFQDPSIQNINQHQLNKTKKFFQSLQAGRYITSFSNTYFQSLIIVPQVEFTKCPNQKILIGKVYLLEELFYYKHPFFFPNFLQQKLTKDELKVRVKFLQIFGSVGVEKKFLMKEFLDSYSSTASNQQKANIKRYFIALVELLQKHNLVENIFKIKFNQSWIETNKLTTINISEGFVIYEKLEI